jgi:hypothetical protein
MEATLPTLSLSVLSPAAPAAGDSTPGKCSLSCPCPHEKSWVKKGRDPGGGVELKCARVCTRGAGGGQLANSGVGG